MKSLVPALAAPLLLIAACQQAPEPTMITRQTPVLRLPAVAGGPGVAYLDVEIPGSPGDLLSVTSPQIGRIEMHESMNQGNLSAMRTLDRIPTVGVHRLSFRPGGMHLMLFEVAPSVHAGDPVMLTFHFADGSSEDFAAFAARPG
jgi:copper(I)-binding protein